MDRVACETAFPVGKEGASAHALRVSVECEGSCAIGLAGRLDVEDGLAGWDGIGRGWIADFLKVGFRDSAVC